MLLTPLTGTRKQKACFFPLPAKLPFFFYGSENYLVHYHQLFMGYSSFILPHSTSLRSVSLVTLS